MQSLEVYLITSNTFTTLLQKSVYILLEEDFLGHPMRLQWSVSSVSTSLLPLGTTKKDIVSFHRISLRDAVAQW